MSNTTVEPTIILLPSGEAYHRHPESPHYETPEEAQRRLSRRFLCQRIGNVVRIVREIKGGSVDTFRGSPANTP